MPEYRFWVRDPSGTWTVVRDWGPSSTHTWNTHGLVSGTYTLRISVRALGAAAGQAYTDVAYELTAAPACTGVTLGASPASPRAAGASVGLTAGGTNCAEYRFWLGLPNGSWQVLRDWDTGNTYTWTTTGLAEETYTLRASGRAAGATDGQAYADSPYELRSPRCTAASLSVDPASPQVIGADIDLSAVAACDAGATPGYRFWLGLPNGSWSLLRDWGAGNTDTWDTAGRAPGAYTLRVAVRAAGASAGQAHTDVAYTLAAAPPCTGVGLSPNPASPRPVGTSVELTASGTNCAEYRFWVRNPQGTWSVLRDWGAGTGHTWSTSGLAPGTYTLRVSGRATGASSGQDYADVPYTLS
jgi:hypothetical protein